MADLPLILSLANELDAMSNRLYRDDGGYGFYPQSNHVTNPSWNVLFPVATMLQNYRKNHHLPDKKPITTVGKEGFQVCMDVQQFKPSELTVKTVDNTVVIEGKHEEREDDHGFISRHFVRKYVLPDGFKSDNAVSTLSSDGVLTIKVPPPSKTDSNERILHIQHTGPAHLSLKDNPKEEKVEHAKKDGKKK